MPPKPKFTREEVATAAFQMIKEGGVSALTARDLGTKLGTSARPIFTLFKNMEEVKQAARDLAIQEFMSYISDYREYTPAFKRIGMMIISYGIHEPELFKLLFLQEHNKGVSFEQALWDLDGMDETCIQLVMQDNGLTREQAKLLFEQMWTHALGLGTIMFAALMMFIKSGKLDQVPVYAEKGSTISGRQVEDDPYRVEV